MRTYTNEEKQREDCQNLANPLVSNPIVYLPTSQNLKPAFSEQTLTEDSHFEAGTISKSQLDGKTTTRKTLRQLVTTVRIDPVSPSNILAGGSDTTTRMDTHRLPENTPIFNLTEPITLREGQRVIVNGQHFTLREIPTRTEPSSRPTPPEQHHQLTQTNTQDLMLDSPDHAYTSEDSLTTYFKCYIPPDIDESNAESVAREDEIQRRIRTRKHKNPPDEPRTPPTQRKKVHKTNHNAKIKQLVQTITLDDLNPHGLFYPNPDKTLTPQDITVLYDSGASITMLPGAFKDSWRNLRPSMMSLSGAFDETGIQDIQVGEFHAQMTLDTGETVRVVIPEAVSLPDTTTTYLLCDTQFLLAGHEYISDLRAPKLKLANGDGTYTMDIIAAHKIIKLLPISAHETTNHRTILLHLPTPYEPPTFYNWHQQRRRLPLNAQRVEPARQ